MREIVKFCVASWLIVSGCAAAAESYNQLEDAAVAQARQWQSGGKAKAIMSSDGMVIFPFGQSMPKLTCSPTRACDVQMQPLEKVKKVILGDGVNWTWQAADSVEQGKPVQHVVFQPRDSDLESNVIITTDRRTYHIKLFAPKKEGVYLNRVGFYYPQELVQSWEDKAGPDTGNAQQSGHSQTGNVMPASVSPQKLAFDYRMEGDANFKPLRVFNDGERVYMEMPQTLRNETNPVLMLLNDKGEAMVVNYRRDEDPDTQKIYFVVDRLFSRAQLRSDDEKVTVVWKRREKSFFSWGTSP